MEPKQFFKYIAFFAIGAFLTAGVFLSYSSYATSPFVRNELGNEQAELNTVQTGLNTVIENIIPSASTNTRNGLSLLSASIPALAVNHEGSGGVMSSLSLDAIPGKGNVLLDTNYLLAPDTQYSATQAVIAAKMFTKNFAPETDFVFHFNNVPTKLLGGPSAGAAMALLTTSLLEGKPIKADTSITGTIESDGAIGPIGGIVEKIRAAGESGLKLLLIPKGQGMYSPSQEAMRQQMSQQQQGGMGMPMGMPGGMPSGGPMGGMPQGMNPNQGHFSAPTRDQATSFQDNPFGQNQASDNIDLIAAAKEKWGLEVIEVGTLAEAAQYGIES